MDEQQLREVYEMVDNIPFTRSKKNINRDFSDGVMMAELVYHYRPKSVELNSYPTVSSVDKKRVNWNTLNTKTLKKLGIGLSKNEIENIISCVPMAIESYLYTVLMKFESPGEEVNVRQQFTKSQNQPARNAGFERQSQNVRNNISMPQEVDEVQQLISEIEDAYAQLLKLQEISKTKDEKIKTLQKRIQKLIFS